MLPNGEKSYIKYEYTDKNISSWGGMRILKILMDETGIKEKLKSLNLPISGSNCGYNAIDIIESFMVCVWLGGVRFSHTALVRFDEVLKKIFGWKRVASISTYTRFFRKFSNKRNNEIFPELNQWFFEQIPIKKYTLDVDSTILTRYGEQEGAKVGYNPKKPGRNAHHPLLAFMSELRMVVNAWLRPGNVASNSNIYKFLKETIAILKDKQIGLLRADSGFYGHKFFEYLEEKAINYIIACKMYPTLKRQIKDLKKWIIVDKGIQITEFDFKGNNWLGKNRRMVVIRQSERLKPKAMGKMLFPELEGLKEYRYQCYVTNLDLPVKAIWDLYRGRADAENRIKELKYDFGINSFCMDEFWATEAAFRMICVSYNIMSLFRQVALKGNVFPTLSTIRFQCFAIGSYIKKDGRDEVLMLSVKQKKRGWIDGLFSKVIDLGPPFPIHF